jgi:hypothetical protein
MLRAQDLLAKVLRSTLPPPRRRQRRPDFEALESRQLLSTVNWINPKSGSWDVASNWSTDTVPGPGDDAVIDVAGVTVTISSNVEAVNSITADDPLVISGGGLTVAANSTISGGLSMTGGSLTASGSGVTLTVTGTSTVSGASLYAQGGASLSLPSLTSYADGATYTTLLQATGTGSVLSMPNLSTLTLNNAYAAVAQIQALSGGDVELPGLT